jgi:serine/threonine-protein kinase
MTTLTPLAPGGHLGRYELLTPIAQGGMATVWAARQSGLHGFRKTVALKTMLPALSHDPQFERMFLAEARLAMRVHHPNVVETLDLGEENGQLFLVMEWVDGESLSMLMKAIENTEERFPMRLALAICAKACRGLHAAHEVTDDDDQPVGIVHRDVSPQNVMISYDGHVKVVDFGVAKSQTELGATQVGQFKGKVPYMAPEQAAGEAIDRRTDIFAMGTLLYRLTTGKHPFIGGTEGLTIANIVGGVTPALPSHVNSQYPVELEKIVMRCLEKDPAKRFGDMAKLAQSLDQVLLTLGAPVADDELSACAKRYLGEMRKQRRTAMRDAARALGWALATSDSLPRISMPGPHSMTPSSPSFVSNSKVSFTPSLTGTGSLSHVVSAPPSARSQQPGPRRNLLLPLALLAGAAVGGVVLAFVVSRNAGSETAPPVAATPQQPASTNVPAQTTTAAPPKELPAPTATPGAQPDSPSANASAQTSSHSPKPSNAGRPLPKPAQPTSKPQSWGAGPDLGF